MVIDKIITLANHAVEIPFLAMERSLRNIGCDLPLWVIPYDNDLFNLPKNAQWLKHDALFDWLKLKHPSMRKYLSLFYNKYHFIDTDCIFLKNPEHILQPFTGFITSCCHWHNPQETLFHASDAIYKKKTTTWQRFVFNSGQYACSETLYDFNSLKSIAEQPSYKPIILKNPYNEQPGLNLLVHLTGILIQNLTLPPYNMESTWAGDYPYHDYTHYWHNQHQKPYIIHWAGTKADGKHMIDHLFFDYLSKKEMETYKNEYLKPRSSNLRQKLKQIIKKVHF